MGPTLVDFYRIGFGLWAVPCMVVAAPYVVAAAVVAAPAIVVVAALTAGREVRQ